MADFPTISLESQLIGRGLNPSDTSATYTDFADRIAKNIQDQRQMEQNLATAKETLAQSRLTTKQKTEAAAAGYNPELIGTMTKDQARKSLETIIEVKKLKVDDKTIDEWYDSLPALVKSSDVEAFANTLTKTTGMSIWSQTGTIKQKTEKGPDGQDHMYNIFVRKDGKQTDLWSAAGEPVFSDIVETAITEDDKAKAMEILAGATKQEAGMERRFGVAESQFGQKQWVALEKSLNTSNAPAARAIGQASVNNMRADRALTILNREDGAVTPQMYDIVATDLAAIFKGGVPDIISLSHQRYGNLETDIASQIQYWLSTPISVDTPEVRSLLKEVTMDVKTVDNDIIKNYMSSVGAAYEPIIRSDPKRFAKMVNAQFRNMGLDEVSVSDLDEVSKGTAAKIKKPEEKTPRKEKAKETTKETDDKDPLKLEL